ncbi:tail completion and sheath stabilizer protein [Campylobacter phage vB_Cj_QDYZ]|uniref:Tail completion and sheath stabilizer protein n=2 Tax=Fletchervirus TaxID=1636618 RepID=A0AAF0GBL4_9CAUD|nr:tail completion and sheath stabilizer protein [Campylobacter phage CP39]QPX62993.1 putative tail completion and sheath stabilizer protein [Campylobacter phage F336]WGA02419.1 tail completion and sheath stabilizer protein [Campylobacter phage vB_Cj_QDYZ]
MNFRNIALNSNIVFRTLLFSDDTQYYCQKVKLPRISLEGQKVGHSTGTLTLGGEVAKFDSITLTLLVDENLEVWKNFVNLINKYNKISTNTGCGIEATSWLEIHDSKNKYLFKVEFYKSKLDEVGELEYSTTDNNIITLDITLNFDYMKII